LKSDDDAPPRTDRALSEVLGLDAERLAERLSFYEISARDEELLAQISELCDPRLDEVIADFYAHLLRFPELETLLRGVPGRVPHLQEMQKEYFRRLTRGRLDADYAESRLRVGHAHQRIGLRPEWYVGGFRRLLRDYLDVIYKSRGVEDGLVPEADALLKAVFLDMSLALDTYIAGGFVDRESAARMQRATEIAEQALQARAETERLKDDLTSMVVHDLKNPVNGIVMLVQLALRKSAALPEAHVGYLRQIERTCAEMTRLIENLLEIARIEEGKMPVEHGVVALPELALEVQREYGPVAEQGGRLLRLDVPSDVPAVIADRALLKRVLANLISNALRHSGSPEAVLSARAPGDTDVVVLRVTDRGTGFPPADLAHVFEKFRSVRRSPTAAPSSDTGLGLPFCKLAVELMGGRIGVDSRPGEETSFWLTLPRSPR
jgi:signal transduction histidine kinase